MNVLIKDIIFYELVSHDLISGMKDFMKVRSSYVMKKQNAKKCHVMDI